MPDDVTKQAVIDTLSRWYDAKTRAALDDIKEDVARGTITSQEGVERAAMAWAESNTLHATEAQLVLAASPNADAYTNYDGDRVGVGWSHLAYWAFLRDVQAGLPAFDFDAPDEPDEEDT